MRKRLLGVTSRLRNNKKEYEAQATNSAMTVAIAAPLMPRPMLNMSIGSRITFRRFETKTTRSGVTVSMKPRKDAKPTVESSAGTKERARMRR